MILKAKLANSALIDQEGRQDVKHARMMMVCTRAFISKLLVKCHAGQINKRAVVNVLDEIREAISTRESIKAASLWGFDYDSIWAFEELKQFRDGKIARWLYHLFPDSRSA